MSWFNEYNKNWTPSANQRRPVAYLEGQDFDTDLNADELLDLARDAIQAATRLRELERRVIPDRMTNYHMSRHKIPRRPPPGPMHPDYIPPLTPEQRAEQRRLRDEMWERVWSNVIRDQLDHQATLYTNAKHWGDRGS